MKQNKKVTDFIVKNWKKMTNVEIAQQLNISRHTVIRTGKRLGLDPKYTITPPFKSSPKESITHDKQKRLLDFEKKMKDQKYKLLLDENEKLQQQLKNAMSIPKIGTYVIDSYKPSEDNEATAVIVASDWHLAETVRSGQVNGLNEFNPEIAKLRVEEFFQGSARIIEVFSKEIKIPHVVLALLGDFINNYLHDDARETNSMSQTAEVEFAQGLICSGIEYLLKNTKCDFVIPCKSGNHARTQPKGRVANEQGVSLEYLMYCNIARFFRNEKRCKFIIEESYHTIVQVYDKKIRFHHGHDVKYNGGVGGITIPANKAIAQWNKSINVDIDVFGHYHNFFDGQNFVLNGSIVGYNAFAISIKASYEKPKQAFFLIDKKRGKTITTPIYFSR